MLKHLLPMIDGIPHKVYVEPFCGGAAAMSNKGQESRRFGEIIITA